MPVPSSALGCELLQLQAFNAMLSPPQQTGIKTMTQNKPFPCLSCISCVLITAMQE